MIDIDKTINDLGKIKEESVCKRDLFFDKTKQLKFECGCYIEKVYEDGSMTTFLLDRFSPCEKHTDYIPKWKD